MFRARLPPAHTPLIAAMPLPLLPLITPYDGHYCRHAAMFAPCLRLCLHRYHIAAASHTITPIFIVLITPMPSLSRHYWRYFL